MLDRHIVKAKIRLDLAVEIPEWRRREFWDSLPDTSSEEKLNLTETFISSWSNPHRCYDRPPSSNTLPLIERKRYYEKMHELHQLLSQSTSPHHREAAVAMQYWIDSRLRAIRKRRALLRAKQIAYQWLRRSQLIRAARENKPEWTLHRAAMTAQTVNRYFNLMTSLGSQSLHSLNSGNLKQRYHQSRDYKGLILSMMFWWKCAAHELRAIMQAKYPGYDLRTSYIFYIWAFPPKFVHEICVMVRKMRALWPTKPYENRLWWHFACSLEFDKVIMRRLGLGNHKTRLKWTRIDGRLRPIEVPCNEWDPTDEQKFIARDVATYPWPDYSLNSAPRHPRLNLW